MIVYVRSVLYAVAALAYLRRRLLVDGKLARFRKLNINRSRFGRQQEEVLEAKDSLDSRLIWTLLPEEIKE